MGSLPLVELCGSARERGRQHGEAAREQIRRGLARYRDRIIRSSGQPWDGVLQRITQWNPVIEERLPDILEEVRGIAEGAGLRFEEILALNAGREAAARQPIDPGDGCTTYSILPEASGDGHMYCGQNWDYDVAAAENVIVVRIQQPPKPTIIGYIEAGQVARHGANSGGLALNANGLSGLISSDVRLPAHYALRSVLDQPTMFDALEAVFAAPQAYCLNRLLSHRDGATIDIETTPERHRWYYPVDGILVHTNHFLVVPDEVAEDYRPWAVDSLYRIGIVQRALKKVQAATSTESTRALIASALRDHFSFPNSVCRHADERQAGHDRIETLVSTIIDLTTGEYYIAVGPPCNAEYEKVPWNLYDDADPPARRTQALIGAARG